MPETDNVKLPRMTEAEWTTQVIAFAQLNGWRTVHFRPARTSRGWRTAVQGDGKGWPDLVMLRGSRLVAAELKSESGMATDDQLAWLDAMALVGAECYIWRPADWPSVVQVLRGDQLCLTDDVGKAQLVTSGKPKGGA